MVLNLDPANKMKSLLVIFSSIIVTSISIRRLLIAKSFGEILVAGFIAITFGILSVYLIFEKQLKSLGFFKKWERFYNNHKLIVKSLALVAALLLMEVLLFSYAPENILLNILRLFLISLFSVGIILLIIQIYNLKRNNKKSKL